MEYGLLGFYAKDIIKQSTSRGNVNFGTKGSVDDIVQRAVQGKEAVTKYIIGANDKDAAELKKRGVTMLVAAESEILLAGLGCTHIYTESGIREIDIKALEVETTKGKKTGDK